MSPPATLADNLAASLALRYAALLNTWDGEITPELEAKVAFLHRLTRDVIHLQKTLHRVADENRALEEAAQAKRDAEIAAAKKEARLPAVAADRITELAAIFGQASARRSVAHELKLTLPELEALLIKPNQTTPQNDPPLR